MRAIVRVTNVRFGPYQCPTSPGEIQGCGSFNTVACFEGRELVVDCLDCGIWFDPAAEEAKES